MAEENIFEEEKEKKEEKEIEEKDQFLDEPTEKKEEGSDDVYTEEGREELLEEDEVAGWEQGFSEGATETGKVHCSHCGKVLNEKEEELVEKEIDGQNYFFCSNECASKGIKHAKKR